VETAPVHDAEDVIQNYNRFVIAPHALKSMLNTLVIFLSGSINRRM